MLISRSRTVIAVVLVLALVSGFAPSIQPSAQAFASLPSATLHSVTFVPGSNTVFAVGASGTVLRSHDGGRVWSHVVNVPGSVLGETLTGVSFIDENRGWAISQTGVLIHTTDGGESWVRSYGYTIFESQGTGHIYDLEVVTETLGSGPGYMGLAAGRPLSITSPATLLMRRHGDSPILYGEWLDQFSAKNHWVTPGDFEPGGWRGTGEFYAVDVWSGAASPERGWVVGRDRYNGRNNGFIWSKAYDTTLRFGGDWSLQAAFNNSGPLYGVSFGSATHGVVVGTAGKAWRTTNAGTTWTAVTSTGVTADLKSVAMTDASWGWAVSSAGHVTRTQNGGTSWTASSLGSIALEDVATPGSGSKTAVAVGASGRIFRTTDGISWTRVNPPPTPPTISSLEAPSHEPYADWHAVATVGATWEPTTAGYIAGYRIAFDQNSNTEPTNWTTSTTADLVATSDGEWTIHVRAEDVWGQLSAIQRRTVRIDATPPAGTISINGGDATTYLRGVTVGSDIGFGPSGSHATQAMRYHDGADWTSWEPYAGSKQLTLTEGTGTKTVKAQFRDGAGNVSAEITDTIELVDPPDPSTIAVQHDAAGVVFDRWVTGYSTAYSGGGYVYGRWTGTELTARFTGSTIRWVGPKQPSYGMADIYIDGVRVAENVDCYAPAAQASLDAVIWESGTLSDGPHTITIKLKGNRNAASSGNVVVIDRFEVDGADPKGGGTRIDDAAATPGYAGSWISAINPTYYDKTYSYSRWAGHVFSVTFTGTKVAWLGPKTPFYGTADIYIDGAYVTTVDAYRPTQGWRERIWESGALSPGTHTLEIRPTGEKNPASTSANVVIDAIDVTP